MDPVGAHQHVEDGAVAAREPGLDAIAPVLYTDQPLPEM
jgi:hypothetical protein